MKREKRNKNKSQHNKTCAPFDNAISNRFYWNLIPIKIENERKISDGNNNINIGCNGCSAKSSSKNGF